MVEDRRPTAAQRVQALVLGVVPGLAHIAVLDRAGSGTLLFVLFVAGADAAIAGLYLVEDAWGGDLYFWGCVAAAAAWVVAWADMARLAFLVDWEKRAATRRRLAEEGVRLYAAGDLAGARRSFRGCLDLDHRDPDVLFWYGCVEARLGKVRRARRSFRRCRLHDAERKWDFPIREQEARLAASGG